MNQKMWMKDRSPTKLLERDSDFASLEYDDSPFLTVTLEQPFRQLHAPYVTDNIREWWIGAQLVCPLILC